MLNTLLSFLQNYGLIAIFLIILLEYACFPVSSEIVLPFSGAFAAATGLSFFFLLPVSICAGLIGTSFCYYLGYRGGQIFLHSICRRFPKTQKAISFSLEKFQHWGNYAVCLGRMIPLCRTYIAFIAGAAGQKPVSFLFSSFLGISCWNTMLLGIGYILGSNWETSAFYYQQYMHFALFVLLALFLLLLLKKIVHHTKP